ncbi:mechanosensitive ion channel domain-containing protein [Loktanella sp. SALINAS62]|uniref:mechanosensitive ion channel family protein n=1 Tax=Loktanella sp. SALINAS62 TaxID=2706124 RepID=UPI0020112053|nr:mechanosensitive ion channel domain-containing protein [Loktanella sp. SALINAS62]
MLAGILILLRQPFEVGDQIVSGGHEGTVERIETRATLIKTYDGRRVVIPNAVIYTDSVVVLTAYATLRSELDIGIGCNDDWKAARKILEEVCAGIAGVMTDPVPETIPVAQGDFANIIRLRWWTKSPKKTASTSVVRSFRKPISRLIRPGSTCPIQRRCICFTTRPKPVTASGRNNAKAGPQTATIPNRAVSRTQSANGQPKPDITAWDGVGRCADFRATAIVFRQETARLPQCGDHPCYPAANTRKAPLSFDQEPCK